MNAEVLYCRFCAESKILDKVLDLNNDSVLCRYNIVYKLNTLNLSLSKNNTKLPNTICLVCLEALNKACDFVEAYEKSQLKLLEIYGSEAQNWSGFEFEDCLSTPPLKEEDTAPQHSSTTYFDNASITESVQVKTETQIDFDPRCMDKVEMCWPLDTQIYNKNESQMNNQPVATWVEYPWVCSQCKVEFVDMSTLRQHAKVQHERCAVFHCIDCSKYTEVGDFKGFISHVRKHRPYLRNICLYCDRKTGKMEKHLKTHVTPPQCTCSACGEIFPDDEDRNKHTSQYNKRKKRRRRGTPITIEELTCNLCQKVYKNFDSLREHKKNMHKTERKRDYTCDKCGKTFYNKGSLGTHIMSHDMARPHVCEVCNKSFSFPNMLRKHMRIHSGDKPYSCEQCGKCFREKRLLKKHEIIHSDSMPFVCAYCSKGFNFKEGLVIHERQHTGLKPYSCDVCCRDFSDRSNYGKHMKIHHGIDTSRQNKIKSVTYNSTATADVSNVMEEWNKEMEVNRETNVNVKEETAPLLRI